MDRFDQIKQQVEREMMDAEIRRVQEGSVAVPVVYMLRGAPILQLSKPMAARMILAEYADGVRHQLRTKEAILAFLVKHGIPHEVVDHEAERNARIEAAAHQRMKAAALNRRRQIGWPKVGMASP